MDSTSLFFKRSIKSLVSVTKIKAGFPSVKSGSVNIIAYHRVVSDIAKAEKESIYGTVVSAASFRKHCELLRKSFDVVSLETAMYFLDGERKVSRPLAVITFDDGYLDFYEEAFPILNEFGFPATVFLPTDFIGQKTPLAHDRIFWLIKQSSEKSVLILSALIKAGLEQEFAEKIISQKDILKLTDLIVFLPNELRGKIISELEKVLDNRFEKYPAEYQALSWEMVREMSRKGISFGGHTANHVVLTLEDFSQMEAEIVASKQHLEMQLGKKVYSFAYPNGEYNGQIKQIVAQAGYKIAVTTEKRINHTGSDLLSLGRISLCEESTRGIGGHYSSNVATMRLGV